MPMPFHVILNRSSVKVPMSPMSR